MILSSEVILENKISCWTQRLKILNADEATNNIAFHSWKPAK